MNRTHKFGVNLEKFTVVFADNTRLSGQSEVYVKLTSSEFSSIHFYAGCILLTTVILHTN